MTETTSRRSEAEQRLSLTQTHPLRPAVDAASAALGLWLLWGHHLTAGIAVTLVPPMALAGWVALRGAGSGLGAARPDTPPFQLLRLVGLGLAAFAAWDGRGWLLAVGAVLYALSFAPSLASLRR